MIEHHTAAWGMKLIHLRTVDDGMRWLDTDSVRLAQARLILIDRELPQNGLPLWRHILAARPARPRGVVVLRPIGMHGEESAVRMTGLSHVKRPLHRQQLFTAMQQALGRSAGSANSSWAASDGNDLILVVESNLLHQKVITRMIEKLGFQVDTVATGNLAISQATQRNYGLILFDLSVQEAEYHNPHPSDPTKDRRSLSPHYWAGQWPRAASDTRTYLRDRCCLGEAGAQRHLTGPVAALVAENISDGKNGSGRSPE